MAIVPPANRGAFRAWPLPSLSDPLSDTLPIPNASDSNYYRAAIGPINWNSAGSYGSTPGPHPGTEETTADTSVLPTPGGRYAFAASYHDPYLRGQPNNGNSSATGSFTTRTPVRARIAAEALTRRLAHQSAGAGRTI